MIPKQVLTQAVNTIAFASIGLAVVVSLPVKAQQAVSDDALEEFLGLSPGTLDALGTDDVTEGAAIQQTFEATGGQTLTFDWNFFTDELTPADPFNDFAFVSIQPLGGESTLADTNSAFELSNSRFGSETGFNTFTFELPEDGIYTLGIGVVDVGDEIVDSGLLIDNFNLGSNGSFETGDFSDWSTIGSAAITSVPFGDGPTDGSFQAILTTPEPSTILGTGVVLGLGVMFKRKLRRRTTKRAHS